MNYAKCALSVMLAVAMAGAAPLVLAQEHAMNGNQAAGMAMPGNEAMTRGEIRKWDPAQGKVTIRHEEIKNLMMPPMSMVFVVQNQSQMQGLKMGDKVIFEAIAQDGRLIVTQIRKP